MKPWLRSALTLTVVMVVLLVVLGLLAAAQIGPVELGLWLVILIAGWFFCWLGGRSRHRVE